MFFSSILYPQLMCLKLLPQLLMKLAIHDPYKESMLE